jgi:hypothetical protein
MCLMCLCFYVVQTNSLTILSSGLVLKVLIERILVWRKPRLCIMQAGLAPKHYFLRVPGYDNLITVLKLPVWPDWRLNFSD